MGYIEGKREINQYSFLPICFDNLISEDNLVRVIDAFVDSLDMELLDTMDFEEEDTGKVHASKEEIAQKI